MGLLDDAIREHLDLKRRRGADPGEVAREQREALTPVPREGSTGVDEDAELATEAPPADASVDGDGADGAGAAEEDLVDAAQPREAIDAATAGETAELDMQSVLGETDERPAPTSAPVGPAGGVQEPGSAGPAAAEEDSLEWEIPGEVAEEQAEEPDEDVLEETPDFLRDTPEQDRLWFEQRPPRDFDFDK
jgi:hypothetical protein